MSVQPYSEKTEKATGAKQWGRLRIWLFLRTHRQLHGASAGSRDGLSLCNLITCWLEASLGIRKKSRPHHTECEFGPFNI